MYSPFHEAGTPASRDSIFRILANEYPGEVASLVALDPAEAGAILRTLVGEINDFDHFETAARIAASLRDLLGLNCGDTQGASVLSSAASDKFDRICAKASRAG